MKRRVVALLAVAHLCVGAAAFAEEPAALERIRELRLAGDWNEALTVARAHRDTLRVTDPATREKAADAVRLVATIEAVLDLPPVGRQAATRADSLRRVAREAYRAKEPARGLAAIEAELEIRRRWQNEIHEDVAGALYYAGRLAFQMGESARGETFFLQAAEVQRHALGSGHSARVRSLLYLAGYRFRANDYAAARELYGEIIPAREALYGRGHPLTIRTLDEAATLTDLVGEELRAADMREEIVTLTRAHHGTDSKPTAVALQRLAHSYEKTGRLDASVATYEEALVIMRRLGEDSGASYASVINGLAVALQQQGDLGRAEPLYRQALVVARAAYGERHARVARFLSNIAFLAEAQGRIAEAVDLYREALAIQREKLPPTSPELAVTLDNVAALEAARGRPEAALPLFEEGLAIRRGTLGETHADVARSLSHLGEAQLALNRFDDAAANFTASLAIRREIYGADHPMAAMELARLADVAGYGGDWASADSLLDRCLTIRRDWLGDAHRDVGRALLSRAAVKLELGDERAAAELLDASAASYEDARLRAGRGVTRATARLANPYRLQASLALERNDSATAWTAVEKLRGRALLDILASARGRRLTPVAAAREDSLRRRLLDAEQRLLAGREAGADTALARLRREQESAAAAWTAHRQELAAADPARAGHILAADDVKPSLGSDEALVGWFDGECPPGTPQRWAYVLTRSADPAWVPLPAPADTVDAAAALRNALRDPGTPYATCAAWQRRVHAERFAPVLEHLAGISRLVVVPGDAMLGVPVEALADAAGAVEGERFTVSYAPSATSLVALRERQRQRSRRQFASALLLGDPPYREEHLAAMNDLAAPEVAYRGMTGVAALARDTSRGLTDSLLAALPRLAATRREVASIAELVPGSTLLMGAAATEQKLVELAATGQLSRCDLIHLATHAIVDDERPGRSALVLARTAVDDPATRALSAGRVHDGLLTADEIVAEWQLDAGLVVLSACETGLGRRVAGEGYVGFTHAFLEAGAGAVLVSLWPVDDRGTELLMTRFYENLLGRYADDRGAGPGAALAADAALAEAKTHLRGLRYRGRRAFRHPFHWSPFVLIGGIN